MIGMPRAVDQPTLDYYKTHAPTYRLDSAQGPHRHLSSFLKRLAPSVRVLELGCGTGLDSAQIAAQGFDLDATDGVDAMAQRARERTGLAVRVLRFDELRAEKAYDAVWAHACLLHLPRAALLDVLIRIHRALVPGGWHFANYKLGDADHRDEGRDPLGRWTNLPSPDWLESCYCQAGFLIEEAEIYRGNGSDGVVRDWLALTVRRPE